MIEIITYIMGRSHLSKTRTSVASLAITIGLVGSALAHGVLLSLPMPEQVTLKAKPSPPTPELAQISIRPSSGIKRVAQPATVKPLPHQKKEPEKRVKRLRQKPAIAPVVATKPAQTYVPEPQPPVASEPQQMPPSPEASPPPERSQQPNKPEPNQQPGLFTNFPHADQASLCGSQQGDCWSVADKRWDFVRDNLEAKLQAKGQELKEVDRDDDPAFRVYEVYENGQRKSFVHLLSIDQTVTYILCDQELSKAAVLARVAAGKSGSGLQNG